MVFQVNFKPIFFIIFQHDKLSIQITPAQLQLTYIRIIPIR